jgi:hypothetical protein
MLHVSLRDDRRLIARPIPSLHGYPISRIQNVTTLPTTSSVATTPMTLFRPLLVGTPVTTQKAPPLPTP